jgi:hypothetical protein
VRKICPFPVWRSPTRRFPAGWRHLRLGGGKVRSALPVANGRPWAVRRGVEVGCRTPGPLAAGAEQPSGQSPSFLMLQVPTISSPSPRPK